MRLLFALLAGLAITAAEDNARCCPCYDDASGGEFESATVRDQQDPSDYPVETLIEIIVAKQVNLRHYSQLVSICDEMESHGMKKSRKHDSHVNYELPKMIKCDTLRENQSIYRAQSAEIIERVFANVTEVSDAYKLHKEIMVLCAATPGCQDLSVLDWNSDSVVREISGTDDDVCCDDDDDDCDDDCGSMETKTEDSSMRDSMEGETEDSDIGGADSDDLDIRGYDQDLLNDEGLIISAVKRRLGAGLMEIDVESHGAPRRRLQEVVVNTYEDVERYQIFLWTALALVAVGYAAVYSVAFMPLNRDPLLYTRIYTGNPVH